MTEYAWLWAAVAVGVLGLGACGDEEDEPERLNGGNGTITMVVDGGSNRGRVDRST